MMTDYISINVVIAGRPFKLRVRPEEEEMVRKAVKDINDKVLEYHQEFPSKDKQDFLSMLLLQQKVEALKSSGLKAQNEEWAEKFDVLDKLLTENLSNL